MKCPRDGTELQRIEIAYIDLEKCHKCDGIWFDYGELKNLAESGLAHIEETLELKYGNPDCTQGDVTEYMRCPKCADKRLQQFTYTYIIPVKVDRCESCFGIWVDKGELDAITTDRKHIDGIDNDNRVRSIMNIINRKTKELISRREE